MDGNMKDGSCKRRAGMSCTGKEMIRRSKANGIVKQVIDDSQTENPGEIYTYKWRKKSKQMTGNCNCFAIKILLNRFTWRKIAITRIGRWSYQTEKTDGRDKQPVDINNNSATDVSTRYKGIFNMTNVKQGECMESGTDEATENSAKLRKCK